MAIVVWFTVALALWHFTIFVPDRFWQGIIGALVGSVTGGVISGLLIQIAMGRDLNETDFLTFLAAIPGFFIGAAVVYWIGERTEEPELEP
jgi:hypothetical protein